ASFANSPPEDGSAATMKNNGAASSQIIEKPPRSQMSKSQKRKEKVAAKKDKLEAKKSKNPKRDDQWTTEIDKENTLFEKDDDDWDAFLSNLKLDLPTTFRITGTEDVNNVIKNVHVPNLTGLTHEGMAVNPPTPIPWYPGGLAWQIHVHKSVVRKVPEFKKMQEFLVYETEVVCGHVLPFS
ncbi:14338_t:CDS:2, partial [Acaulospora colombiana]